MTPETATEQTRPFTPAEESELQRWLRTDPELQALYPGPYQPLGDPVHGGDVLSRVEAST